MSHDKRTLDTACWPAPWRWMVIALATLSLCSCRGPSVLRNPLAGGAMVPTGGQAIKPESPTPQPSSVMAHVQHSANSHPVKTVAYLADGGASFPSSFTSGPAGCEPANCGPACGPVCAPEPQRKPHDEYICDGGDRNVGVSVAPDWRLYNLDPQDTVAHFDTLDGRTRIEASNKICVYAPRFGAVRTVTGPGINGQIDQIQGMLAPHRAVRFEKSEGAATNLQRQPIGDHAAAILPEAYNMRQSDGLLSTHLIPGGFQDGFMVYENLLVMRTGEFDNREKARLAQVVDAAITWTADQAVQVIIDGKQAKALLLEQKPQTTYTVEDRREAKLRVLKIANTDSAQPGEVIDFTIRYDNIGTAPLGNVVLVDHLMSRLEYVPDSAQSSLKANFSTSGGSTLVLRWEIDETLPAGAGGLVRFKCRVR